MLQFCRLNCFNKQKLINFLENISDTYCLFDYNILIKNKRKWIFCLSHAKIYLSWNFQILNFQSWLILFCKVSDNIQFIFNRNIKFFCLAIHRDNLQIIESCIIKTNRLKIIDIKIIWRISSQIKLIINLKIHWLIPRYQLRLVLDILNCYNSMHFSNVSWNFPQQFLSPAIFFDCFRDVCTLHFSQVLLGKAL